MAICRLPLTYWEALKSSAELAAQLHLRALLATNLEPFRRSSPGQKMAIEGNGRTTTHVA